MEQALILEFWEYYTGRAIMANPDKNFIFDQDKIYLDTHNDPITLYISRIWFQKIIGKYKIGELDKRLSLCQIIETELRDFLNRNINIFFF